jgi:hypothetical protein
MKTRSKIPAFRSDREAADYWARHDSVADAKDLPIAAVKASAKLLRRVAACSEGHALPPRARSAKGDQYMVEQAGRPMRDRFFAKIDAVRRRSPRAKSRTIVRDVAEAIEKTRGKSRRRPT